jgi:hypothetical protein
MYGVERPSEKSDSHQLKVWINLVPVLYSWYYAHLNELVAHSGEVDVA